MNNNIITSLIIIVLLLFLCWHTIKEPREKNTIKEIYTKDTILIRDTIRIETKGRLVYRYKYISVSQDTSNETSIVSQIDSSSFVSCLDTTTYKTTINVCFFYPENKFLIDIKALPDTITKYTIIEKPIFQQNQYKEPWYFDAMKVGGGILLGFFLGKLK